MSGNSKKLLVGVITCVSLFVLGCGEDSFIDEAALLNCETAQSQPLKLGTGNQRFEPLTQDPELLFTPGFQGGWHVWGAIQIGKIDPIRTVLDFELIQDDQKIGGLVLPVTLQCGAMGYEYFGIPVELHFHRQPDTVADREMLMRLTLTERDGTQHTDSITFMPRCCNSFE
jgi:hypothetical protein